MAEGPELVTNRLRLRRWRQMYLGPMAAINADPLVMEHMPATMTEEETAEWIAKVEAGFEEHGFGMWAVEYAVSGQLVGFAGLQPVGFEAHFTPAVEVAWRLASEHGGKGFATEAARAAIRYGFTEGGLSEIVGITVAVNTRCTNVMHRIGMTNDPRDDFDHPDFPEDSALRRHVLYRMTRNHWLEVRLP